MATEAKKNPLDALSLLVDAANAQSSAPQQQAAAAEAAAEASKEAPTTENVPSSRAAATHAAAAYAHAQQRSVEMELREALHRQAMEREAMEGEAMLQQRAALMSAGFGGLGGGGNPFQQDTEYMQQLRLEALVQQRRQETLAQLALAQDYNPEAQALIGAQLRQAAMVREQELLMASGGMGAMDPMAAALRQREGARNENALLRLFEERDRQHKMAALGGVAPAPVGSMEAAVMAAQSPGLAAVTPVNPPTKTKEETALALAGSKVTVLPCRARGMPMDHNAKTAYFVVPEDVKHGAELVCSYDHCRNAGIKFRYCVFCSLPVAKRNFFKKHKHEGKIPPERLADGIPREDEVPPQDHGETPQKSVVRKWNTRELLVRAMASNSGLGKPDTLKTSISSGEMAQLVEIRKRKWEKLLDTRPLSQSETELVLWVRKVLAVSDLTPPPEIKEPPKKEEFKFVEVKKPDVPKEHEEEKISAGEESSDEEEEEEANSTKDDDEDEDMEEDAPAEEEEKDGNISDGSASSNGSSVDLRAHKRAKTAE
mmetsp:Transcript_28935/g.69847  ORF Transcript_28935/g.69847 Transcript_28935/m.69847 type:complete len:542 (-) Transcript_28935:136-1761(-)